MRRVKKEIKVSNNQKIAILAIFPILCFFLILFLGRQNLIKGYIDILKHPSVLVTDYFGVGGLYSGLLNMTLVALLNLAIIYTLKIHVNGLIFTAYFVALGFSAFGKTPLTILPIYLGGILYSRYEKKSYKGIFGVSMFSTGLCPVVGFLIFNDIIPPGLSLALGIFSGILIGLLMPPLSAHMLKFHDGFNLYNVGFTAGILGNMFASLVRGQGIEIEKYFVLSIEYDFELKLFLVIFFIIILYVGYYINKNSFAGYDTLMSNGGRLISDYILTEGFGISLINSAILGLLSIAFVTFLDVELNGALIAAIFTVFGFGVLGKHPLNCIPVVLGVLLASYFNLKGSNNFSVALTGLFATTLSPLSGVYGAPVGLIAGILHYFVVSNVGVLHGGVNLYNNGFSGGMVAGVMIPILNKFNLGEKFNDRIY